MDLLADENVGTEWIQALDDDGHDVVRVVDVDDLGVSASDRMFTDGSRGRVWGIYGRIGALTKTI